MILPPLWRRSCRRLLLRERPWKRASRALTSTCCTGPSCWATRSRRPTSSSTSPCTPSRPSGAPSSSSSSSTSSGGSTSPSTSPPALCPPSLSQSSSPRLLSSRLASRELPLASLVSLLPQLLVLPPPPPHLPPLPPLLQVPLLPPLLPPLLQLNQLILHLHLRLHPLPLQLSNLLLVLPSLPRLVPLQLLLGDEEDNEAREQRRPLLPRRSQCWRRLLTTRLRSRG